MKRTLALSSTLIAFLWALPAVAGLHPALADHLATLAPTDMVQVLVVLEDQVDIRSLDGNLRGSKATRGHRHEMVVTALRGRAAATQGPLLGFLNGARNRGDVAGSPIRRQLLEIAETE